MLDGDTSVAEHAVRQYMLWLDNPNQLVDQDEVRRHAAAADAATDPIAKLQAIAARRRAETVDPAPLREAFVAHARAWASAERIPVFAFRELRVPDDVLRDAGFDVPAPARAPRTARRRGDARGVGVAAVTAWALGAAGPVTVPDAAAATGASTDVARRALRALVDAGQLVEDGTDPNWRRRGPAPRRYTRVEAAQQAA